MNYIGGVNKGELSRSQKTKKTGVHIFFLIFFSCLASLTLQSVSKIGSFSILYVFHAVSFDAGENEL